MNPDDDLRISRLETQVAYLLAHLGIDPATAAGDWSAAGPMMSGPLPGDSFDAVPRPGPIGGPMPGGGIPPQVASAIQSGKLIVAIKIYREMTGLSLKDAKAQVDSWAGDMGVGTGRRRW
jgi:hypothetical protein